MYTLVMSRPRQLSSSSTSSSTESIPEINQDTLTPSPSPNAPPSRLSADFFSPHSHPSPLPSSSSSSSSTSSSTSSLSKKRKDSVLPGLGHSKGLQVVDHADFLERWGETDRTRTRDGSNPMIESYLNTKFFL